MSVHRFEVTQVLGTTRDEAWRFFADPRNLATITPPHMDFRIRTPLPRDIYAGLLIVYRVRPVANVPVTWVTEITHVREGEMFIDEQRIGPYRLWHHQHLFREVPGGIEMRDIVHYVVPLGPIGSLVDRLVVTPQLNALFAYRTRVLERMFPVSDLDHAQPPARA